MYNNKSIIIKLEVTLPITEHMIPVDCCKNKSVIKFFTDNMTSKFEVFSRNNMDALYMKESIETDWLQMLYEYSEEEDTPYSGGFDLQ